jgi:lysosomal acid lipase/cholesteryl ester hydrolase
MSTQFWSSIFPDDAWIRALDTSMWLLFNWKTSEISPFDKSACYRHLYSPSSVKSIAHWFQILRSSTFSMYDDDPGLRRPRSLTHVPITYPLESIQTPLSYFYGGADTLSDISFLLKFLPRPIYTLRVENYEHLDCIWASSAHKLLFPAVIGTMRNFGQTNPDGSEALSPIPDDIAHCLDEESIEQALAAGVSALQPGESLMSMHGDMNDNTFSLKNQQNSGLRISMECINDFRNINESDSESSMKIDSPRTILVRRNKLRVAKHAKRNQKSDGTK